MHGCARAAVCGGGGVADGPIGRRSAVLASLLEGVGWSVARLAHEVNREMGVGYVSRTTVSEWINSSRVPRQPLPTLVAHVLSQATGAPVAVSQLWPGVARSPLCVAADDGTWVSWDLQGTKALISGWLANGGDVFDSDRRVFMAVSGTALTAPAWQYVGQIGNVPQPGAFEKVLGASGFSDTKVSPALLEYFTSLIGAFRRMDDLDGGSKENLKQIGIAIRQVNGYLHNGAFTEKGTAQSLVSTLATLAQIAGWMAFDAELHGLAQRYFRLGLQATHSVNDHGLGAHILSFMSYQAAHRNQPHEASALAEAAVRAAGKAHPIVRTVAMTRVAHAHAITGNVYGFQSASAHVRQLFEQAQQSGGRPSYLYWLDSTAADTYQGHSMLLLSLLTPRSARSQLDEAERLLAAEVDQTGPDRPRDALFFGAWLARAHIKKGDLYRGLGLAETAVDRMSAVASPRSRKVLQDLDHDLSNLRQSRNLPEVRSLRQRLQSALVA